MNIKIIILLGFCLIQSMVFHVSGQVLNTGKLTAPGINLPDSVNNEVPLSVNSIEINGNRITKESVITREIVFKVGDTIPAGKISNMLVRSRQNLLNSSLFNFVTIVPLVHDGLVDIHINVIERWYTWPTPVFEIAETNFNTWWLSRDFSRLNYGLFLNRENFRGRKEAVRFKFQSGYTSQYAIQYQVPYLNKKQNLGMEVTVSSYKNREIVYGTTNNKRVFYNSLDKPARQEFYARLGFTYRQGFYNTYSLTGKYQMASVLDTVTKLSEDYFPDNKTSTRFLNLSLRFQRDRRDIKAYPLNGYFFDAECVKMGLGLFENEPDVLLFKGSVRKYHKLVEKWYLSGGLKAKYSINGEQPYYLQKGMGYFDETIRGFEYYVIDGQRWGLARANLKYEILRPKVHQTTSIGSKKFNIMHYAFYLTFFADAGFVDDKFYHRTNPLANQFLYSSGIGIDFVSYYDMVMRFEYSLNKLGEKGFFINFTAPL